MDAPSTLSRDLTDPLQNQAVLDAADDLLLDRASVDELAARHGAAVTAEAQSAARSRQRLAALGEPVHLSVVWAMYRETGRMKTRSEHPHGEDLVRAKVAQLDWLTVGLPGVTWSIVACDDGCPDVPSSAEVMEGIVAAEGYPATGHRGVRVLRLADVIGGGAGPAPASIDLRAAEDAGGSVRVGASGLASGAEGLEDAGGPVGGGAVEGTRGSDPLEGPVAAADLQVFEDTSGTSDTSTAADARGRLSAVPALAALTSTDQSRKGGSIVAALTAAAADGVPHFAGTAPHHVLCYTDADLSSNLAQLGSLAAPVVSGSAGALGQRYGLDEAVLVKPGGPVREPHSTGDKPDRMIVLFRHFVRATLIPSLAHVLDTQAGFKAFDAAALDSVLARTASFDETFDVELLILLAQQQGAGALAVEPVVFTEDFAATNFPSVDPGARHLAMVQQVVDLYDRLVAGTAPAEGEAAALLELLRTLDLDGYVRIIGYLRDRYEVDPATAGSGAALFGQRWSVAELRQAVGLP